MFVAGSPERPYEEVALVRVTGGRDSPDGALLAWLKHRAADSCADAVVGISYVTDVRTDPLTLLCPRCEPNIVVNAARGGAIRYTDDPDSPGDSAPGSQ